MSTDSSAPRLRESVAEEVRVLLARRRLSGVQLAHRIGRSQAYVSRRLTGDTPFDVDDLEVIAQALGVTVTDLVKGGEEGVQTTGPKLRLTDQRPSGSTRPMGQGSATRPHDGRPKGRAAASVPNPRTRRPARVPSSGAAHSSTSSSMVSAA